MIDHRDTVQAWRWDYLSPEGWFPWTFATTNQGEPEARGWFTEARATCLRRRVLGVGHRAPDPDCLCGLHGIESLSVEAAAVLDRLAANREVWTDTDPRAGGIALCLSRVTLTDVLPGSRAPDHPDSIPDPPHTVRGRHIRYDSILTDRRWPAKIRKRGLSPDGTWPPTTYVADLGAWVREEIA